MAKLQMTLKRQRKPRKAKPPSARYSNTVTLEPGVWDLTLVFGRQQKDELSGEWMTAEQTRVTLPWAILKRTLFEIAGSLTAYEHRFGHVGVPLGLVPEVPAADHLDAESVATLVMLRSDLFFQKLSQQELDEATAAVVSKLMPASKNTTH